MAIIKKSTNNKSGEAVEKRKPSYTVGGNVNWHSLCGKQCGDSSKKLKVKLPYDLVIPPLGINPDKL